MSPSNASGEVRRDCDASDGKIRGEDPTTALPPLSALGFLRPKKSAVPLITRLNTAEGLAPLAPMVRSSLHLHWSSPLTRRAGNGGQRSKTTSKKWRGTQTKCSIFHGKLLGFVCPAVQKEIAPPWCCSRRPVSPELPTVRISIYYFFPIYSFNPSGSSIRPPGEHPHSALTGEHPLRRRCSQARCPSQHI